MQVLQSWCRPTLFQQIHDVQRQPLPQMCVGSFPQFPRALFSLPLRPGALLLDASLLCGVGCLTNLIHLVGVGVHLVQLSVQVRFACFAFLPSLAILLLDALHDIAVLTQHALGGCADLSFSRFSALLLPACPCPLSSLSRLWQTLFRTPAPILAALLFECAFLLPLPDDFPDVLKAFACPVGAIEFVGPNQLELSRGQRPAEFECARCVGPRQHPMLELAWEVTCHRTQFVFDRTWDLLAGNSFPTDVGQLSGFETASFTTQLLHRGPLMETTRFAFHTARSTTVGARRIEDANLIANSHLKLPDPALFGCFPSDVCSAQLEKQATFIVRKSASGTVVLVKHAPP